MTDEPRPQFSLRALIAVQTVAALLVVFFLALASQLTFQAMVAYVALRGVALAIVTTCGALFRLDYRRSAIGGLVGIVVADLVMLGAVATLLAQAGDGQTMVMIANPLLLVTAITSLVAGSRRRLAAVLTGGAVAIVGPVLLAGIALRQIAQSQAQGTGLASAATVFVGLLLILSGLTGVVAARCAAEAYQWWRDSRKPGGASVAPGSSREAAR